VLVGVILFVVALGVFAGAETRKSAGGGLAAGVLGVIAILCMLLGGTSHD